MTNCVSRGVGLFFVCGAPAASSVASVWWPFQGTGGHPWVVDGARVDTDVLTGPCRRSMWAPVAMEMKMSRSLRCRSRGRAQVRGGYMLRGTVERDKVW